MQCAHFVQDVLPAATTPEFLRTEKASCDGYPVPDVLSAAPTPKKFVRTEKTSYDGYPEHPTIQGANLVPDVLSAATMPKLSCARKSLLRYVVEKKGVEALPEIFQVADGSSHVLKPNVPIPILEGVCPHALLVRFLH
jgi:hypothetical protein